MKALIIRVEGAGVYKDPRKSRTSDKVYDDTGKKGRYEKKTKKAAPYISVSSNTFSVKHVANLLRVLCGQRPVPSLRKTNIIGDICYEETAKKARVHIENDLFEETVTQIKSIKDSWNPSKAFYHLNGADMLITGGLMYWDRIKRFLGISLYENMIKTLKEIEAPQGITGPQAIEILNKNKNHPSVIDFCGLCKDEKRTSMINLIHGKDSITIHCGTGSKLNLLLVVRGVERMSKVTATIAVPIPEEMISQLKEGSGVATFLEGGFAYIEDIEDWSELLESDTVPVEEGEYVSDEITTNAR